MANWEQLRQYIHSNYQVEEELPEAIKMVFELRGGRTQLVFVTHYSLMDGQEDWVVIESPFGELGRVDLGAAVAAAGNMVCGGVGLYKERYFTLRHAVPLANLDLNEFERPLRLIITSADSLEARLTGRDEL
jgi:hypothetical protein